MGDFLSLPLISLFNSKRGEVLGFVCCDVGEELMDRQFLETWPSFENSAFVTSPFKSSSFDLSGEFFNELEAE